MGLQHVLNTALAAARRTEDVGWVASKRDVRDVLCKDIWICRVGEGRVLSMGDLGRPHLTTPGVGFRWYKDGALLTPGGKYQTLSEPRSGLLVLEIRAAGKEDLGLYECEVRRVGPGGGG